MTRVYKLGNNVAIEENSEIVMLIPCRSLRIEPEDNFVCIHDLEVQRTRNIVYSDLQNQSGALIGTKQDVIVYLSPFVGFDSTSTASPTIWGGITGNIGDQTDLQNSLASKADLVAGKIPASQIPNGFDEILEFLSLSNFPVTGDSNIYYIAQDTNKTYRWAGSSYVVLNEGIALGETSSTAYRGDRGKIAFDHAGAVGNPHGTTKSDVGLSNVDNTSDLSKPVSTAQQNALNLKQNLDAVLVLAANVATTSTVSSDAGLNVNLVAGKKYKLSLLGKYQSVATATGIKVGFISTSGAYNIAGTLKGLMSIGTANSEVHCTIHTINASSTTVGSFLLTTSVGAINTPHFVGGEIFIDCISSGQIRLQIASEVNGNSTQLNSGTCLILKQLN